MELKAREIIRIWTKHKWNYSLSSRAYHLITHTNNIIKTINPNRPENYIFGDMHINFLKFNEHAETEEFLDMLYANNILPIITKPTRLTDHTATLIDHIYTNCLQNFTAEILTVDITDHLPIFCLVRTQPTRNNSNKKYFRDYSWLARNPQPRKESKWKGTGGNQLSSWPAKLSKGNLISHGSLRVS